MRGKIKAIIPERYFGFITGNDGIEYFLHKRNFTGSWDQLIKDTVKDRIIDVVFDAETTPKGKRANNCGRI